MDMEACNYDSDATMDDGTCEYAEENYDCDGNCTAGEDCAGDCGGSAELDECGVCNGDGIADGACDCDGNVEDCAGDCGGTSELDECGVCNGDGISDGACGCDGNTENCPNWQDDPGAYEFISTLSGAIVIADDGSQLGGAGDALAALDDSGNVRGVGMQITPTFGPYEGTVVYEMTMRSNSEGDLIHFAYYDASEDEVFDIAESYSFIINDIIGNLVMPFELNIQTAVVQSIELNAGWNWVSINVDPDPVLYEDLTDQLASIGDAGLFVGSQSSGTATNYPQYGMWAGTIQTLAPGQMYRIKMDAPATFVITGMPVDVESNPIELITGWNWLGYTPQNPGDVAPSL